MRNRTYQVYKHTNKINGKVYIGITGQTWQRRWRTKYRANRHFHSAILKYGEDAFEHEVLFDGLTKAEAHAKEIELIAECGSADPEFGYNVSSGGEAHSGCEGRHYHTEESRARISAAHKGKRVPDATRARMSESHRGKHSAPTWIDPADTSSRMHGNSYASLRKKETNVPVRSVSKDGAVTEYPSMREAAKAVGVAPTSIYRACAKKRKTCAGMVWEYVE